jgi:hypothetical protein
MDYYLVAKVFKDKEIIVSGHYTFTEAREKCDRLNREDNHKGHYHYEVR